MFDRGAVTRLLPEGDQVAYAVTGEVQDEAFFAARGTVRVVRPHLKSPNGGESLAYGSTVPVTWENPGGWSVKYADLYYSSDDGTSWNPIAQGVGGQSFGWVVPPVASTAARVRVDLYDAAGLLGYDSSDQDFTIAQLVTGVTDEAPPLVHALFQNSPNPFNPRTNIRFDLPGASSVRLTIHGVDGRLVRTLIDEPTPAGRHHVTWDGTDDRGNGVATGVYYYRLRAGAFRASRRLVLLK